MKPSAKLGYQIGAIVAAVALAIFFLPSQDKLHTLGPANTGHDSLQCQDCHVAAEGTTRQQVQANLRYLFGQRDTAVDFQHQDVGNAQCLDCHVNPKDNHPVHRFNEPRFAEARAAIHPEQCASCHMEHQGVRVTMDVLFCAECHQDLVLKNDPIDVSHEELIAQENWESCLGCHDYHGNHVMEVPISVDDMLALEQINDYFNGAPSPYSDQKFYQAKEEE